MFATGIRTVEFCRRWGIADRVRDWGFPRDFPFDNVFVTCLAGYELAPHSDARRSRDTPPIAQSPEQLRALPAIHLRSDPRRAARAASRS